MKTIIKLFAAICAGGMLLSASGCGGNTESSTNSDVETTTTAMTTETTAATADNGITVEHDETWERADSSLGLPELNLGWTTDEMVTRAMMNTGNRVRLANVMKRAQNNETIKIGVIGGSITQGTGASSSSDSYAVLNTKWWIQAFPDAAVKMQYLNAGIGATGSYIGVHRAERDLFADGCPDVVVVEFSVNDTVPARDLQSYNSLVRRILEQENEPAVILLFMTQEDGTSLVETHKQVGYAYDLPMISYKNAVLPEIDAGSFTWADISPDNIHPNSNGHGIAGELLWNYYNSVYADLDEIDTTDLSYDADAFETDVYQSPAILGSDAIEAQSAEGFAVTEINTYFPHNWKTETAGTVTFEVEAQNIGILYQKTTDGKSGQYEVYVDGTLAETLDGNFENGWGNYAEAAEVFTSESSAVHTVTIQMAEGSSAEGFSLLGLMVS